MRRHVRRQRNRVIPRRVRRAPKSPVGDTRVYRTVDHVRAGDMLVMDTATGSVRRAMPDDYPFGVTTQRVRRRDYGWVELYRGRF